MKPSILLNQHRTAIRAVVESNRTGNPRVFGSVLSGKDSEGSDLDLLVDPTEHTTLFDPGAIQHELNVLLGIKVDVHTPMSLPEKFRETVVSAARAV